MDTRMIEILLKIEGASNDVWKNWELAKMAHAMRVNSLIELHIGGQISSVQLEKNLKELEDELEHDQGIFENKLGEYEKMINMIGELADAY